MINVAFFNQDFLMEKEIVAALGRVNGVRIVVISIPASPTQDQAEQATQELAAHGIRMLFTVNDWGLHQVLSTFLKDKSILHVNWCGDDPFYDEIFRGVPLVPLPNRIDFVTDRRYVSALRKKGLATHFLPLASDPAIFSPTPAHSEYKRSACFVGNSYRSEIEAFTKGYEQFFNEFVTFVASVFAQYRSDTSLDLDSLVEQKLATTALPPGMSWKKAAFVLTHMVSYLFRKQLVVSLVKHYSDFKVFGDGLWLMDLPREKVSTEVGYYTNLCRTYKETKVNIDINRVVIREGLTQRVFDCLLSGSFVVTGAKPIVRELFETTGDTREVVEFDNENHLMELIDYYSVHDTERHAIVERGRKRVLAQHTYDHRIAEIFRVVASEIGKPA
jgi:spore maturation protein CgeB